MGIQSTFKNHINWQGRFMQPYLVSLFVRSRRLFITLAKVMLPIMLLVRIADQIGVVDMASTVLTPVMSLIGMPPEAGLIWASCLLINIYGAVAVIAGLALHLDMTTAQLSALCAMMLFAHGIPVEQAIVKKAGASFWATAALRIFTALFYAAFITWISRHTGYLSEPVDLSWMAGQAAHTVAQTGWAGWLTWAQSTLYSLIASFAIITGLLVLLDVLQKTGITDHFTKALLPVLRVSGLSRDAAPVTTIGILLGLTYGGALIIDEAKSKNFAPRTLFLSLSWLSLSHSLIEDTVIMLALGADIWVVLAGRVILTLIIMMLLAWLTRRWQTAPARPQTQGAQ
ncbi:nucleoside recognition domain-containing protein [Thalassospira sp.]|uniref:nucleoside recognition domain-containing protein n=1 Tax=Thalassospira sp. TaxID=1912094 RepID=UPI003AA9A7F2